jgi:hypothetical protein
MEDAIRQIKIDTLIDLNKVSTRMLETDEFKTPEGWERFLAVEEQVRGLYQSLSPEDRKLVRAKWRENKAK